MSLAAPYRKPIALEGVCNFRDLGGLKTVDGRMVRYGKICRSDELSRLTDADLRRLRSLSLTTIVDLRIEREINRHPDKKPVSVRNMITCSLDTPGFLISIAKLNNMRMSDRIDERSQRVLGDTDAKFGTLAPEQVLASVIALYEKLTTEPECVEIYKRIFVLLLRDENTPLLFHCMAGKDRTGIVAALILASLGVEEKTILKDYLISNVVAGKKYAEHIALSPSARFLYEARPEYLTAALTKIRNEYGTVDRYLREVIGVDMDEMKHLYLE